MRTVSIDPVTRIEGHARIDLFVDDDGRVANAYVRVPELRGFERFCVGRPLEELPRIMTRICGICPEAHHIASAKACEAAYGVEPPPAAVRLRRLMYNAFFVADHSVHFYILSGPDFLVGPGAPAAERNVFGMIRKIGEDNGRRILASRAKAQRLISLLGGRTIHQVTSVPGGVTRGLSEKERTEAERICTDLVEFGKFTVETLERLVLANPEYLELLRSDEFRHETSYMGMVDADGRPDFYDGTLRVVDASGAEIVRFAPADYAAHISERVESWTYAKFPYLSARGWTGFETGPDSGVYRTAPLARLNVASGMSTPLAQEQYERMMETLDGPPVHGTMAYHWARVIELLHAAEAALELARDPEIAAGPLRVLPNGPPSEGVGVVEAPRGTLIHHYRADCNGIVEFVNLIVGTTHNNAAINLTVRKAATALVEQHGEITEEVLNRIEMAFRAYDPCMACATHALPGRMPLDVRLRDATGREIHRTVRD